MFFSSNILIFKIADWPPLSVVRNRLRPFKLSAQKRCMKSFRPQPAAGHRRCRPGCATSLQSLLSPHLRPPTPFPSCGGPPPVGMRVAAPLGTIWSLCRSSRGDGAAQDSWAAARRRSASTRTLFLPSFFPRTSASAPFPAASLALGPRRWRGVRAVMGLSKWEYPVAFSTRACWWRGSCGCGAKGTGVGSASGMRSPSSSQHWTPIWVMSVASPSAGSTRRRFCGVVISLRGQLGSTSLSMC